MTDRVLHRAYFRCCCDYTFECTQGPAGPLIVLGACPTERLTAGVAGALPAVLLQGGQLLLRLAELAHAAAGREARGLATVRLAAPREAPLEELLLVVVRLYGNKRNVTTLSQHTRLVHGNTFQHPFSLSHGPLVDAFIRVDIST